MRLIENSPFENFKSNILELEAYEGPELKIKFKTMDGYLDFLKKIGTNPEYFEAMYLETLKSRHELSKARDPRAEIFRRIKAGLEKLKYKGELTFKSDLNKIAQAVWGKDVNESHLNFYLPDMIGIWDFRYTA